MIFKITNENGKQIDYKVDNKIIKGLHITNELSKVQENCKQLNIEVKRPDIELRKFDNTKITVIGDICILTFLGFGTKQHQYLIQKDLDLDILKWQSHKKIESRLYSLIKETYETMMVINFNRQLNNI